MKKSLSTFPSTPPPHALHTPLTPPLTISTLPLQYVGGRGKVCLMYFTNLKIFNLKNCE